MAPVVSQAIPLIIAFGAFKVVLNTDSNADQCFAMHLALVSCSVNDTRCPEKASCLLMLQKQAVRESISAFSLYNHGTLRDLSLS
jgi:hypothetical protein